MNQQTIEGCLQRGAVDDAMVACQAVLQVTPNNSRVVGLLGMCHFRKQEFEKAVECFRRATLLDPKFVDAGLKHAQALDRLRRYSEAYEVANHWYHVQPNHPMLRGLVDQLQQYSGGAKQGWERTSSLYTTVHFSQDE
jgi:Flp pilus assembly protein TadD